MKYIFLIAAAACMAAGCGQRGNRDEAAVHSHARDHYHDDHDHGDHDGHDDHDEECSGHSHAGHDHGASPGEMSDEIIFPASQAARSDFEVREVKAGPFAEVIKTGGRIMPAQGDEVSVVAPAAGIVSFAGASLAEGSPVGKGKQIFLISSKNVASGDILTKNKAAYEKARSDLERAEKLLADRIISQRDYNETKLAYETAKAEYEALAGTGQGGGIGVSSPIQGFVTSLSVSEGDYVETGQLLATISRSGELVLRAEVSQRYLPRLARITDANFTLPYDGSTYRLSELGGRLLSVSRNLPAGATLVPVIFQFRNTASVIPGTYVEVSLLGAVENDVISLPLTAITEQQGVYYVYVQLDEEGYERREVKLGGDDGLMVRVLSGVEEGERVVTRGAVNLKMASASGAIPHGHEH